MATAPDTAPFLPPALAANSSRRDQLALGSVLDIRPTQPLTLVPAAPMKLRRSRIWELDASFHCSIVGTCLTTADLRSLLDKMNIHDARSMSEHNLHRHGVSLAGQRDGAGKLLQKALDKRHARAVSQFEKAVGEPDVSALWDAARASGEIPGAYWATLTHPLTGHALMKRAFGEVHMLSHLVGAANRADIRRLTALETENADLRAKVDRQQAQIHQAIATRDLKITTLTEELTRLVTAGNSVPAAPQDDGNPLADLVAALERRLAAEQAHAQRLAARLQAAEERAHREAAANKAKTSENEALRVEIESLEDFSNHTTGGIATTALADMTLLYVGGRTGHVADLRGIAEQFSASLIHHDGGLETSTSQLAGLIARAEMVFFPVDCISHDAMQAVKRLSRQGGKPFVPLRSAGLATFVAALRRIAADMDARQAAAAF
jgi:hypothetical protein